MDDSMMFDLLLHTFLQGFIHPRWSSGYFFLKGVSGQFSSSASSRGPFPAAPQQRGEGGDVRVGQQQKLLDGFIE